jgi:hypothetical protein
MDFSWSWQCSEAMLKPVQPRNMVQRNPQFPAASFRGNEDRNADNVDLMNVCPSTRFGPIPSG